ncbi:(2E,6E)-farnesyl diphosphate synthase [Photobacterium damselae]|uniref:Octaprenyl-diphosphate synthase/dimethylallyltransferase/geranyltranstransferase/ geranylgeranyl pyrophosphate synthetase n=4 Tax=Photobacterium damselae TaxID=38293 RepID=D0YZG0_PHODD|nr:(2E,6E)-farnesyl diphosphate synthase [Photobacterium damselae]EEZ41641.1 octaprenyl-diphosphate synthase/dimethylallyltransferase/geranyltranstransferase/geranylgeranyl pyrophosphate synthetase [Photobacterium damselae subsp. damselae CIP 102761]EHA1081116.1 (2E,6E)-farnesyl diphosphate synthase [Photobacterium damselae]ELI6446906.1 (2E,6E)-farnesyl diphosphate synthase [Photobacterium damselae]ELV7515099.1 (2E,6E)-farnesyl diphosphate synthase [Photobacterium damselae]KAB1178985.1 (2E,6E)
MTNSSLLQLLQHYQERNNQQLTHWLDAQPFADQTLLKAMKYGALLGGKRVRPFLTYVTGNMLGVNEENLDTPAAAIECIHAYSLIHDDLPAMDDDELRRGQPTCHIAFDEATAVLAGDALQTLAFEILAEGTLSIDGESQRIKMIKELAQASGAAGMCMGQALDLDGEGKHLGLTQLEQIHKHKTGALIRCAVRLGALAAGEKGLEILPQLNTYAEAIGLAFQVQDDILDVISDTETLGKPQGSDIALDKSTYPALLGLEGAQQKAQQLYQEAVQALEAIPYDTTQLEVFARYLIERKN